MRYGYKIKAFSTLAGILLWGVDALIDPGQDLASFTRVLIYGSSPHDLIMRVFILVSFIVFGLVASAIFERQIKAQKALSDKSAYLDNILRSTAEFAVITTGTDLTINYYNPMAEKLFGRCASEATGTHLGKLRVDGSTPFERVEKALKDLGHGTEHVYMMTMETPAGIRNIEARIFGIFDSANKLIGYASFSRDITDSIRDAGERDRLIERLKEALGSVKALSGLLPICSYCKKIRDDRGQWNQIETYIRKRSEADFTHSICPECIRKELDGLDKEATNS